MDEFKKMFSDFWKYLENHQVELGERKDIDWWKKAVDDANELAKNYGDKGQKVLVVLMDMIEDRSVRSKSLFA